MEQVEKKLEDLTVVELKSVAYDLISQLEVAKQNLTIVQKRIAELSETKE